MQLQSYLKEIKQSQDEFGQKLVPMASQGLISQWIRGKTRITLDYALQIESLTAGAVSPQDCADMFLAVEPQHITDLTGGHTLETLQEDRRAVDLGYRQPANPKQVA